MGQLLGEYLKPGGQCLQITQGDLLAEQVDAIVNAANEHLQHGGGIASAIVRRGGSSIQEESNAWIRQYGPVSHAEPAYTGAGNLPCKYVIHAVGPVWGSGQEDAKLAATIQGSLKLADQLEITSIAFPAISTGIFGFPKDRAASIIFAEIQQYLDTTPDSGLRLVRVVLYDPPTVEAFIRVWHTWQSELLGGRKVYGDDHVG